MLKTNRHLHTRSRSILGQATVEFALILPVILTSILGVIELGYLAHNYLALANAAREGVRAAAVGKTSSDIDTHITTNMPENLQITITKQYSADNGVTWSSWPADKTDSGGTPVNGVDNGDLMRIVVQSQHQQLTNFIPFLNQLTLNQSVVMRRESS